MTSRKLAIMGCGAVVRSSYAVTLPRPPLAQVAWVYDRSRAAAEAAAAVFDARVAESAAQAFTGVDLALIATPPASHADLVRAAIEAGVDVFCEKPFVPTLADARRLVELARAAGRKVYVGHFRRTFSAVRFVRELLSAGLLGPVRAIDVREGGRFAWPAMTEYFLKDPLGGVLLDTGSHAVDMALYAAGLEGEAPDVTVDVAVSDGPEPAHDVCARGRLEWSGRSVGFTVQLSRRTALANRVRISCERGTVELPTGPLGRVRITGPSGSAVAQAPGVTDYNDAFATQWRWLLDERLAAELGAERFLAVTAVLDGILNAPSGKVA